MSKQNNVALTKITPPSLSKTTEQITMKLGEQLSLRSRGLLRIRNSFFLNSVMFVNP